MTHKQSLGLALSFLFAWIQVTELSAQSNNNSGTALENAETTRSKVPQRAPEFETIGQYPLSHRPLNSEDLCGCDGCQSSGACGPQCAKGCPECVPSRKTKLARWRECLDDQKKPALGFCVEEVQYGANAGYPSFGVVSHGPWYNGPTKGPGHGKLSMIRSMYTHRKSVKQSVQQKSCDCRRCKMAKTGNQDKSVCDSDCEFGCCSNAEMELSQPVLDSYPLYDTVRPQGPSQMPSKKTNPADNKSER